MKKTLHRHIIVSAILPPEVPVAPVRRAPRIIAVFCGLTLLGSIGLFASRPAHSVGGPVAVSVANPSLAVTTTETAYHQPFQTTTQYSFTSGFGASIASGWSEIKVPAGKRLVIQSVSAFWFGPSTVSKNLKVFLDTSDFGRVILPTIVPDGTLEPGATLAATITAEPGATLTFEGYRSGALGSGDDNIRLCVSGYLVDI